MEFDPAKVSYAELLGVFWQSHDPGYDPYLRQYRNAVFYVNDDQKQHAEHVAVDESFGRLVRLGRISPGNG